MTIREFIKKECINKDMKNFVESGLRTEKEVKDYYEEQSDMNLIRLYDSYFGIGTLMEKEV